MPKLCFPTSPFFSGKIGTLPRQRFLSLKIRLFISDLIIIQLFLPPKNQVYRLNHHSYHPSTSRSARIRKSTNLARPRNSGRSLLICYSRLSSHTLPIILCPTQPSGSSPLPSTYRSDYNHLLFPQQHYLRHKHISRTPQSQTHMHVSGRALTPNPSSWYTARTDFYVFGVCSIFFLRLVLRNKNTLLTRSHIGFVKETLPPLSRTLQLSVWLKQALRASILSSVAG